MKHLMLDIETMASIPDAAIVAIGGRVFTKRGLESTFEAYIPPGSAQQYGRVDPQTMKWWGEQDAEVRAKVFGGIEAPKPAAERLAAFVKANNVELVWAYPPTFDLVILRHWFGQMGVQTPWHYRAERDARTLMRLAEEYGLKFDDCYAGIAKHNPLADADAQTKCVQRALSALQFGRIAL